MAMGIERDKVSCISREMLSLDRVSPYFPIFPLRSVQLSHNPSVHVYHALRLTVEQSNTPWLRAFLEQDGLGSLVEAVEQLSSTQFTGFSDAILLLDCIACVRSVLNTSLGMTHFLNSDIYMRKLVKGKPRSLYISILNEDQRFFFSEVLN